MTTLMPLAAAGSEYVALLYWQLAVAASLILICGAISLVLQLGLDSQLLMAAVRTVVQLLLVGLVLTWIFQHATWYLVLLLLVVMTVTAGILAVRRTARRYRGMWWDSILSMWASSWLMAAVAVYGVVQVRPWCGPIRNT